MPSPGLNLLLNAVIVAVGFAALVAAARVWRPLRARLRVRYPPDTVVRSLAHGAADLLAAVGAGALLFLLLFGALTVADGAIDFFLAAGFAARGEQPAPQQLAGFRDTTSAPAQFAWQLARRYPAYARDTALLIVAAAIVRATARRFRYPRSARRSTS